MTASTTIYSCTAEHFGKGTLDWDTDQLMMMLVSSSYTFSQTSHSMVSTAAAFEIAAGFGYTAGGTTCAATVVRVGGTTTYNLADGVWVASGGPIPAFRGVVVYGNVTRNGVTGPLAMYGLADITPAAIPATADGATLRIRVNPSGLFTSP